MLLLDGLCGRKVFWHDVGMAALLRRQRLTQWNDSVLFIKKYPTPTFVLKQRVWLGVQSTVVWNLPAEQPGSETRGVTVQWDGCYEEQNCPFFSWVGMNISSEPGMIVEYTCVSLRNDFILIENIWFVVFCFLFFLESRNVFCMKAHE